MKKRIGLYTAAWIVLFALFNVIAFVSVDCVGQEKYTPAFWIGYIFITLTFIGQFICAVKALNEDDAKKLFYNISLIKMSYGGAYWLLYCRWALYAHIASALLDWGNRLHSHSCL